MTNDGMIPPITMKSWWLCFGLLCMFFIHASSHPLKYRYTIDPCRKPGGPHAGCSHPKPIEPKPASLNRGLPNVVAHNPHGGAKGKGKDKGARTRARARARNENPLP
ncbi:hypothetical protein HYC85_023777 [Camellia sinensis]|uniref:Uncharacterized protein n=1 Tax=Camellia sinensis TaxID=4442 RepID=A0A7J7GJG3_CAMSI|nr:hypothetical protein HYC85_023777 [Camellia sinensis]